MKRIQNKSQTIRHIEHTRQEEIEELLRRLYVDEGMTAVQLEKELGVRRRIISKWLGYAGLYSTRLRIRE